MLKIINDNKTIKEVKTLEDAKRYITKEFIIEYETIKDFKTIEDLNEEFIYLHEELGYSLFKIVKSESSERKVKSESSDKKVKTLKELKEEYGKDLENIKNFEDLKALATNYIRQITWKKEKDLTFIHENYNDIKGDIIKDILKNGYDIALKTIKQNNLHKAYNLKYIYEYYGKDFLESRRIAKEENKKVL